MLATKVNSRMHRGPNGAGLSRKAIMAEIDHSLRRLGTDYVDLYQIHRWDYGTPIEETMEALHDVVKAGKARYIGASSMYAWQFAKALHVAERNGWTRFVTMQNYVNLLYREEEREMLPLCESEGIGVIPWSPLARGRLTRDWNTESARSETDEFGRTLYAQTEDADRRIVERVSQIANARGVPRAQVALAWVLAEEADYRTDRRRDQAASSRRCGRGAVLESERGGNTAARRAVCAACGDGVQVSEAAARGSAKARRKPQRNPPAAADRPAYPIKRAARPAQKTPTAPAETSPANRLR